MLYIIFFVIQSSGKKYENIQGSFVESADSRYPNKGCKGSKHGALTQRKERAQSLKQSDEFQWMADPIDPGVDQITFFAIGVTEEGWFGKDPISLQVKIDKKNNSSVTVKHDGSGGSGNSNTTRKNYYFDLDNSGDSFKSSFAMITLTLLGIWVL